MLIVALDGEEDEQIGRSIALILAVVAFELARLGRNWLAHLADEQDRAFIETHQRAAGRPTSGWWSLAVHSSATTRADVPDENSSG